MSTMQLDPMGLQNLIDSMKNTEVYEVELHMDSMMSTIAEMENMSLFGNTADVFYDDARHCSSLLDLEKVPILNNVEMEVVIEEIAAGLQSDYNNPMGNITRNMSNYVPPMTANDETMFI